MGVRVKTHHQLLSSVQATAKYLSLFVDKPRFCHSDWLNYINALSDQFPAINEYVVEPGEVNPIEVLKKISSSTLTPCYYITDVGQHQMWAAQSLFLGPNDRFLTSGGMGAMGFGLPAAIGSSLTGREITNILITGDGSFQLNIQELETVKRNKLNLKIIVFNNQCHGMVRQFQESYFEGNCQSTVEGYTSPDFVSVARAYGISASRLQNYYSLDQQLVGYLISKGQVCSMYLFYKK